MSIKHKIKQDKNNNLIWIYGKHPVLKALFNNRRKIHKVIISKNNQAQLAKILADQPIKINKNLIKIVDNNFISSLFQTKVLHQGYALQALPLPIITDEEFLIKLSKSDKDNLPPILILDQLNDANNIGAIIRSAVAFNIKNIIITKHNFPKDSGVICKASAGMVELANLITVGNLNNFLVNLKNIGYWCIGLDGNAKNIISDAGDYQNIALIIGSEAIGIRNLVKKNCDLLIKIPMFAQVESLNAGSAAAIALYELIGKKIKHEI